MRVHPCVENQQESDGEDSPSPAPSPCTQVVLGVDLVLRQSAPIALSASSLQVTSITPHRLNSATCSGSR